MMKKNIKYGKSIAILCILAVLISMLAGCAGGEAELKENIVGRWSSGKDYYVTFYSNGIGDDDGDHFIYEISGTTLTLTSESDATVSVMVEIDDKNHLVLKSEDGVHEASLYRCDAEGRRIIGE